MFHSPALSLRRPGYLIWPTMLSFGLVAVTVPWVGCSSMCYHWLQATRPISAGLE
ncbi:uncharacterized protein BDV17DRAFT_256807 [Aspergillus undulatus]|uniref:uncharacterized protein n=1 Tax=Aspergillus undulatus TaxID=1810928 RepID=UPI003CCCED07